MTRNYRRWNLYFVPNTVTVVAILVLTQPIIPVIQDAFVFIIIIMIITIIIIIESIIPF